MATAATFSSYSHSLRRPACLLLLHVGTPDPSSRCPLHGNPRSLQSPSLASRTRSCRGSACGCESQGRPRRPFAPLCAVPTSLFISSYRLLASGADGPALHPAPDPRAFPTSPTTQPTPSLFERSTPPPIPLAADAHRPTAVRLHSPPIRATTLVCTRPLLTTSPSATLFRTQDPEGAPQPPGRNPNPKVHPSNRFQATVFCHLCA